MPVTVLYIISSLSIVQLGEFSDDRNCCKAVIYTFASQERLGFLEKCAI